MLNFEKKNVINIKLIFKKRQGIANEEFFFKKIIHLMALINLNDKTHHFGNYQFSFIKMKPPSERPWEDVAGSFMNEEECRGL